MPLRLKSLELHGYKTFANRTLFEFAEMVTAIVGPNGSGKSNITDSVRWVLGEQSYSLLRAKKTDDMIFSGSEGRARAGMASATISFDNSDGWLPIDFTEVAMTRRAYRDGLNEYILNGQRVRLKDITELLSQSGLAERTYTVISQGLVDVTLSLRADERRRLFEEAAGIGLYRSRRDEALRRLETTKRNLDRVQDILAEIKPRLASLERQARRAQEYEAVRADLQVLLREWYGYYWHNAQKELAESQRATHAQETKLEHSQQEQIRLARELESHRERTGVLREELNTLHKELAELHVQREAVSRELAVSEEKERSLSIQQDNYQGEVINLGEEFGRLEEQLKMTEQDLDRQASDLEEAHFQLEAAHQALVDRQAERDILETTIQAAQHELATLNASQGQLQASLVEKRAQKERIQKVLQSTIVDLDRIKGDSKKAESEYQSALMVEQEAEKNLKTIEDESQKQHKKIDKLNAQKTRKLEERTTQVTELARMETLLDVLDQAEATLTGYTSGTQLLLKAAQQQRLFGARGSLNNYLEMPVELEVAISAVLGDFIDAVLLDVEPDRALDLLKEKTVRGILLPLMDLKPERPLTLSGMEGDDILGIAAEMVQVPPELHQAVELLLGRVIVVRDRKTARRVLKGQPSGTRAVTLHGEVFHASGPVFVIRASEPGSGHSLFGRARQRRETASGCLRLKSQLEILDRSLIELETNLSGQLAKGNRLEQLREKAFQDYQERIGFTQRARMNGEGIERRLIWTKEEHQRLQNESLRIQTEEAGLTSELKLLAEKLAQGRESLQAQNAMLDTLVLDEFQSQFSHWKTLEAVAERALNDIKALCEERRSNLERVQRAQALLQIRLNELDLTREGLKDSHVEYLRAENEITERIQDLNSRIEPIEIKLKSIEQEQSELQKEETNARQSTSLAEHLFAQTRITLARRQESLNSLRRHIENDFGLVAFEYVEQISGPTPLPLEGMVEQLPKVSHLSPDIEEIIKRQRAQLRRMGPINPEAQAEYLEVKQRFEFLTGQLADLEKAEEDVHQVIGELDSLMESEFRRTYDAVNTEFLQIFSRLFGGGSAHLVLTDQGDMSTAGIDIEVRLPGRRIQNLALLSGGERSLTATSLIFAILKVSPTPFCVLDEVDAMLDEVNIGRFRDLLHELSHNTQFVIVTHNRNTVQVADVIYGVTMGRDSVSQVLSLKLDEIDQVIE
jgi:chromosome segregation protein